jgi:hypothetical protein
MPHVTLNMTLEEIREIIFQLPSADFLALVDAIQDRADTVAMMQLAETGFAEWNEPGVDIYDADA